MRSAGIAPMLVEHRLTESQTMNTIGSGLLAHGLISWRAIAGLTWLALSYLDNWVMAWIAAAHG